MLKLTQDQKIELLRVSHAENLAALERQQRDIRQLIYESTGIPVLDTIHDKKARRSTGPGDNDPGRKDISLLPGGRPDDEKASAKP